MTEYFLGFDLSTQQLKIIVTNEQLVHVGTYNVEFDSEYSEKYGVKKGVLANGDEIVSPVAMWLDSIDYVFGKMKEDGFDFSKVKGISGSAQQHGSVYWSEKAPDLLKNLDKSKGLSEQLKDAFTFPMSPNWQDHSTGQEIKDFEEVAGGPDNLAKTTGSRAHYRFTGLQIRKLAKRKDPAKYAATFRISLVSSFIASLLIGSITGIEEAEACGMNLYDISKSDYDDELLALAAGAHPDIDNVSKSESLAAAKELRKKLGEIKQITYKSDGVISNYFVEKFGFSDQTKIYSFTGDNLATIMSLPLGPNDCLMSLGTSTTVLIITKNYLPSSQYHLFKHPSMPDHYMGMICYCNGALAREKVRNTINEKYKLDHDSWDKFNEILNNSKEFDHRLGIYFPLGEIVPNASAQEKRSRLDDSHKIVDVESWDSEEDVTSIIESQTLSCRLRAGPMLNTSNSVSSSPAPEEKSLRETYDTLVSKFGELETDGKKQTFESLTSRPNKCFYVGGASNNRSIIEKMSSILGANAGNYKVEIPNACALGGAFKASWSYKCESSGEWIGYDEYINSLFNSDELDKIDVVDKWENYFDGVAMLAKMEQNLKTD